MGEPRCHRCGGRLPLEGEPYDVRVTDYCCTACASEVVAGLPLTTGEGNTGPVEGMVPSQWLLDETVRRQQAEDELDALREQLDAARQALRELVLAVGETPVIEANENQRIRVSLLRIAVSRARAALGVEGPAAGDGQP